MEILSLIGENTYIVAAALWVLGTFLKGTPKIPDWSIPFVLTAAGVAACVGLLGVNVPAVMQGVLCAGGAVLADQAGKQLRKAGEGD